MGCDMTSTEHAVLMVLCRYANEDGGDCFPSVAEIARCSHFAENPVRRALSSLQTAGWIAVSQQPGKKRFFSINAARIKAAAKGVADQQGGINQQPLTDQQGVIDQQGVANQQPLSDQQPDPLQISKGTPCRSASRKEQEKNKEENTTDKRSCPIQKPEGVSDEDWADYKRLRKEKRLPITAKALASLRLEAEKAGKSMSEVIDICLRNSWAGFKASWLNKQRGADVMPAPKSFAEIDYTVGINPDGSF